MGLVRRAMARAEKVLESNKGRARGELLTNWRVTIGVKPDPNNKWYQTSNDNGTAYIISSGIQVGAKLCMTVLL